MCAAGKHTPNPTATMPRIISLMLKIMCSTAHCAGLLCLTIFVTACADTSLRVASMARPYRVEVVQGNFVSREQVQALQTGMSRQQVREILGTPLVTSLFHADRWEYVFTLQRPNVAAQTRRLTVFFSGDTLARVEGDDMPSEAEFVASLATKLDQPKVPQLEASEAQLARFPAPTPVLATDTAPPLPAATAYPPLE